MPVMDGFAATRAIREHEQENKLAPLVIVALTAGVFEQDRRDCFDAGMDDFLAKPINVQSLKMTLLRHLATTRGEARPAG